MNLKTNQNKIQEKIKHEKIAEQSGEKKNQLTKKKTPAKK